MDWTAGFHGSDDYLSFIKAAMPAAKTRRSDQNNPVLSGHIADDLYRGHR